MVQPHPGLDFGNGSFFFFGSHRISFSLIVNGFRMVDDGQRWASGLGSRTQSASAPVNRARRGV
jgi:hypothetical protein